MKNLLITERADLWPLAYPNLEVVAATDYLTDAAYARSGYRVFNLCRSYRYQSKGYYVSLLADARGHNPLPSVQTIVDLSYRIIFRLVADDLEELVQAQLGSLHGSSFTLSIYFGRNLARKYDPLSRRLFSHFKAPLLRAEFERSERSGQWQLRDVRPISLTEVPESHKEFLHEAAALYFASRTRAAVGRKPPRYAMAILVDPEERQAPSNAKALDGFIQAAARLNIEAELIQRSDQFRLAAYDALFIRTTTRVDDYAFRFASQAEKDGLVVIDDPTSILRCANKVYLQELLRRHRIRTPKAQILHKDNLQQVREEVGLPCIFKIPDGSFSVGVEKAADEDEFAELAQRYLQDSELVVVQEFMPSDFDWRVGVIDGQPIFVCKYYMAKDHWQIYKHPDTAAGKIQEGESETILVEEAPALVVQTAVRAANLIGRGLYGVDLKQIGDRVVVIEVNDNPNVDFGVEDLALGSALYDRILAVFNERLEDRTRLGDPS